MLCGLILGIIFCALLMVYALRNVNAFLTIVSVFGAIICAALMMKRFLLADGWMVVFIAAFVGLTFVLDEYVLP